MVGCFLVNMNKKGQEVEDFCTKTIHLFKCSPAQVHTEPLSSLWTLNISMGESKWRMTATFAVRTGLEEKRIGHKQL